MEFKNNVPFIKEGLEVSRISFSGGRTAASIANHGGLTHLDYYGKQRFGDVRFFQAADPLSAWAELLRLFAVIDDGIYYLEFNDTEVTPHGYSSSCTLAGVSLRHSMTFLNDAIVCSLEVADNPEGKKVSGCMVHGDFLRMSKPSRVWGDWELNEDGNFIIVPVKDSYSEEEIRKDWEKSHDNIYPGFKNHEPAASETFFGITSNSEMELSYHQKFRKARIDFAMTDETLCVALAFGHEGAEKFRKRLAGLRENGMTEAGSLVDAYYDRLKSRPQLSTGGYPAAQSLLVNIPAIIDSLKVKDIPGGKRAADSGYWIWGWDSMVHSDALCLGGDTPFVVDMLEYYKNTSDPELGIFHAATLEGKPYHTMAFPAQCIYGITLYNAYAFTGDKGLLDKYLPFAKWVLDKAGDDEIGESGLIKGPSLYPDHPGELGQDGENDISVFNNSIYYQALRAASELFRETGDRKAVTDCANRAERMLANWSRFFDEEKGYFFDSLDARDFSPRRHYPCYGILWITPFASDLANPWKDKIAQFMKNNFPAPHGLRMFPKWDDVFMRNGHHEFDMYMPAWENCHRELMKATRDTDSAGQLLDNMEWCWKQLSVLEALTCGYANHGITLDNPGRKQAFCAKAWLSMFYHVICGINIALDGISFSPSDPGVDIAVDGLEIRGRKLDINISGTGWKIKSLTLNGEEIKPPFKIPFSELKKRNKIKLLRSGRQ